MLEESSHPMIAKLEQGGPGRSERGAKVKRYELPELVPRIPDHVTVMTVTNKKGVPVGHQHPGAKNA